MSPLDASCIKCWRCIDIVGGVLLFGAVYNLLMKMWRMFVFSGIWVTKLGADIIDVSLRCNLASSCCVVPCDVYTSEFGTCPIGGDGVVPAERFEEMFSMNRIDIFDTKIIHDEDKEYWTPLGIVAHW